MVLNKLACIVPIFGLKTLYRTKSKTLITSVFRLVELGGADWHVTLIPFRLFRNVLIAFDFN